MMSGGEIDSAIDIDELEHDMKYPENEFKISHLKIHVTYGGKE